MSRPDESAISRLLEETRRDLDRVEAEDLASAQAAGALVVDRNVLEWRLDPSSPHRLPVADDPDRRIVLVCNEGYSSSLAAHTLQRIGLANATDLCGGYQAWLAAGAP